MKVVKVESLNSNSGRVYEVNVPFDANLIKKLRSLREIDKVKTIKRKGKFYWAFSESSSHLYDFLYFCTQGGYEIKADKDLKEYLKKNQMQTRSLDWSEIPLKRNLYPHQKEAIRKIVRNDGQSFLRDLAGLGKTSTALVSLSILVRDNKEKGLIICPDHLISTWVSEAKLTFGLRSKQIVSTDADSPIYLIPLSKYLRKSRKDASAFNDYLYVVIEESNWLKNTKTKKYKMFSKSLGHTNKITFINAFDPALYEEDLFGELKLIKKEMTLTDFKKNYFYFSKDEMRYISKGKLVSDIRDLLIRTSHESIFSNYTKVIKTPLVGKVNDDEPELSLLLKRLESKRLSLIKGELLKKLKEFPQKKIAVFFPNKEALTRFSEGFPHPHAIGDHYGNSICLFNAREDARGLNLDHFDACLDFSLSFEVEKREQLIARFQRLTTTKTIPFFLYFISDSIEEEFFNIPTHLTGKNRFKWLQKRWVKIRKLNHSS